MKLFFTIASSLVYTFLLAQNSKSGIYLSENDFIQGKISFSTTNVGNNKMKDDLFFSPSKIIIKQNTQKTQFDKDSIYGYIKNNQIVRCYNHSSYTLMNPNEKLMIYSKKSFPKGKGSQQETLYFFSVSANSPIQKLSISNLKNAFIEDSQVYELIDLSFKKDVDLLEYDNLNKRYKINRILSQTNH